MCVCFRLLVPPYFNPPVLLQDPNYVPMTPVAAPAPSSPAAADVASLGRQMPPAHMGFCIPHLDDLEAPAPPVHRNLKPQRQGDHPPIAHPPTHSSIHTHAHTLSSVHCSSVCLKLNISESVCVCLISSQSCDFSPSLAPPSETSSSGFASSAARLGASPASRLLTCHSLFHTRVCLCVVLCVEQSRHCPPMVLTGCVCVCVSVRQATTLSGQAPPTAPPSPLTLTTRMTTTLP